MKAKIKVSMTVTADDGAAKSLEYEGELIPTKMLDVVVYGNSLMGVLTGCIENGMPLDHPRVLEVLRQMKAVCEAGVRFGDTLPAKG